MLLILKKDVCIETDLTGNGFIDLEDVMLISNNVIYYIICKSPCTQEDFM